MLTSVFDRSLQPRRVPADPRGGVRHRPDRASPDPTPQSELLHHGAGTATLEAVSQREAAAHILEDGESCWLEGLFCIPYIDD